MGLGGRPARDEPQAISNTMNFFPSTCGCLILHHLRSNRGLSGHKLHDVTEKNAPVQP